jgi:hypothetical protein
MKNIVHKEKLKHADAIAYSEIIIDGKNYWGTWVCEECGHRSGPVGTSSTLDTTLSSVQISFERHAKQNHSK